MIQHMAPSHEKFITILSIDGGGVRGVIPATILAQLESRLQDIDKDQNARIADYFDFIAGTSAGGLITGMITVPDSNNRPVHAATDVVKFFENQSASIFGDDDEQLRSFGFFDDAWEFIKSKVEEAIQKAEELAIEGYTKAKGIAEFILKVLMHPKYDGENLHREIKDIVKDTKLSQAVTNVVIPTFDLRQFQPVVFSSLEAKKDDSKDAPLYDICIGTSAAPYFFPPHYFETNTSVGKIEYNLVDGGLAANNPTLLAVREAMRVYGEELNSTEGKTKLLILSLGTGAAKMSDRYTVKDGSGGHTWGLITWFTDLRGNTPLIDVLQAGNDEMTNIYMSTFCKASGYCETYLRIQNDLSLDDAAMDKGDKDHVLHLESIGNKILDNPVTAVSFATGRRERVGSGNSTNRDALYGFAEKLSEERKRRVRG